MTARPPDVVGTDTEQVGVLVEASRSGDRDARETLARWCLPRVRRTVILSCGSGPDVDDLVQTTMARVFTRIDTFRGDASFFVWVDRITVNVVKDHFRRKRWMIFSEYRDEAVTHQPPSYSNRPDHEAERMKLLQGLAEHFGQLKPNYRLPLILAVLHGYTVPEIAVILDLSFEAAKKRLLRGRRDLLGRLKRDPACRDALRDTGR